jgi:hypothetical protein
MGLFNSVTNLPKLRDKKTVHYYESPSSLKKESEERARIKLKKKNVCVAQWADALFQ